MKMPYPSAHQLTHVPEHIRDVLATVRQELADFYGDKLQGVVLFGSYARGDFRENSDVDIMPIVAASSVAELNKEGLFQLAYQHHERNQIKLSIVPTLASHYAKAESFLLMFVQKDGIEF